MILDADRLSQWQIRQNRWGDAKPPDSTSTGSTEKAVIVCEAQDGNLVADRSICIRPVVDAATPFGGVAVAFAVVVKVGADGAITRLGAVPEGVLRGHRLAGDGSRGDTAYFSILAPEWPAVRARLEARLAA